MNITSQNERLMIARLILRTWYPRRYDAKASKQIAEANNAAGSAKEVGRFNKILVSLESIKPLQSRIGKLRKDHYRFTAPWTDRGERVLPIELYFEYVQMVRESMAQISVLADDFALNEYPVQREAARARLGDLFRADDYPQEVRSRFGVVYKFEPLPNPEDVRVWGIGEDAARQIELELRNTIEETTTQSHKHIVDQVLSRSREFVKQMREFGGKRAKIHEASLDHLRDITALVLRGLNISGDQELHKAAEEINDMIAGLNVDQLRHGESLRIQKTREVEDTLKKFAGVFGGAT